MPFTFPRPVLFFEATSCHGRLEVTAFRNEGDNFLFTQTMLVSVMCRQNFRTTLINILSERVNQIDVFFFTVSLQSTSPLTLNGNSLYALWHHTT